MWTSTLPWRSLQALEACKGGLKPWLFPWNMGVKQFRASGSPKATSRALWCSFYIVKMYERFCIVSQHQPATFTEVGWEDHGWSNQPTAPMSQSMSRWPPCRWQEKLIPEDNIWKALSSESKDFIRCPLDTFGYIWILQRRLILICRVSSFNCRDLFAQLALDGYYPVLSLCLR